MTTIVGLECRVGLGRVSVATDAIELVGEYSVGARLPLTDRIGYSIGVWGDQVVLSVCMTRSSEQSRTTAGLLLSTPGTAIRWAFEIAAPVGLVEIGAIGKPPTTGTRWLRTADLGAGRSLMYVDVHAMIEELGAVIGRRLAS